MLGANGLSSPLCGQPEGLSKSARFNCDTAHFAVAPYPTGNYAFDVNIDTGVTQWSNNASAVVQNFTQLGWMWMVALVHGLVVMLEWCYSVDLPGRALLGQAAGQLRAMGVSLTGPWLALALSLLAALVVYHGIFRRRVIQTLGQALTTLAMMALGSWVIVNPAGTVGELQQWSDQAGVGVLALAAGDNAERPRQALSSGLGDVFGAGVQGPWCYLEFGDVGWCDEPHELDPSLTAAALRIARGLRSRGECRVRCSSAAGGAWRLSSELLQRARTNGEVFLALSANGPQRNSAKTPGTLLNVLCGGGESVANCHGRTAAQAEFRSAKGTYWRAIGLLLIWAGGLGMILLFGFLAMRLLMAGIAALFYLLLAPIAVLVAVLGEPGRAAFREWGARLLLASVSKLAYSFALGLVLAVTAMLLRITVFGWWAQWLLVSSFWWAVFLHRHRPFGLGALERRSFERGSQTMAAYPAEGARPLLGKALPAGARRTGGRLAGARRVLDP